MTVSLRLRLALWYGGLTGAAVILVCAYAFAVHSRAHYEELDTTLRGTSRHVAGELANARTADARLRALRSAHRLGLTVTTHDREGRPVMLPDVLPAVAVDVRTLLADGARPAYPPLAALAPALHPTSVGRGTLGLAQGVDGARWRVYVVPDTTADGRAFDLVTAVSLAHLDASVGRFGNLMTAMAVIACLLTFTAGWLIAGRALRPVALLTDTARGIARSRVFSGRVRTGASRDELGRLAITFNEMLSSLEQAYAAQQRFVSDASHELRAPITVIQANLELVQRHPEMPAAERSQAIAEAFGETTRLARLVADLLVLARADSGVPIRREILELDRVLMEVLGEARHLTRGQRLEITAIEPVVVEGDRDRLRQLLLNPIDNAIRYTAPGDRIVIALERRDGMADVSIRDSGIGIAPADLPHVFERFFRADPARTRAPGGTGLGLGIARWIAEQHGGSITLASAPGAGTTARIRLPLAA